MCGCSWRCPRRWPGTACPRGEHSRLPPQPHAGPPGARRQARPPPLPPLLLPRTRQRRPGVAPEQQGKPRDEWAHVAKAEWSVVTPPQRRDRQLTRCRMCHPACVPPVPEIPHAPGGGTAGSAARAPPVLSASCSSCRHPRPPVPPCCASRQRPGRGRTGPGPPLSTGGETDRGQGLKALSTVRSAQLRRRRTRLLRATRASRSSSYAVSWAPAMMPAAAAEARHHLLLARVGIVPRHRRHALNVPTAT